jgi:hypothetical protein
MWTAARSIRINKRVIITVIVVAGIRRMGAVMWRVDIVRRWGSSGSN